MEKHPCRDCIRMPGGQNMAVEPCRTCPEPERFCSRLGAAGIGSVPLDLADYRPRTRNIDLMEAETMTEQATGQARVPDYACKRCGNLKPRTADHFQPHARTADGLHTTCRDCLRDLMRAGRNNKKKKKPAVKKARPAARPSPPEAAVPPRKRNRIRRGLNFYGHEELMQAIETDAAGQFRAFNAHVLFILHEYVNRQRTGIVQ